MKNRSSIHQIPRFLAVCGIASLGLFSIIATNGGGPGGSCERDSDCAAGAICGGTTCCWPQGLSSDTAEDCCGARINEEGYCCVGANRSCADDVECCNGLVCRDSHCCIPMGGVCSGDGATCCGDLLCIDGSCNRDPCLPGCFYSVPLGRCVCNGGGDPTEPGD
jgi:hypothetical protein